MPPVGWVTPLCFDSSAVGRKVAGLISTPAPLCLKMLMSIKEHAAMAFLEFHEAEKLDLKVAYEQSRYKQASGGCTA